MWLDRFSGHSTPSQSPPPPQNRSYSPAPQRPSGLGPGRPVRPPYGPRTSSLNVSSKSNLSTTSLSSQRVPNGSILRGQVSPPPDFADPLKVLEAVIGKSLSEEKTQNGELNADEVLERPSQLVKEVDFGGLSLQDFARNGVYEAGERGAEVQKAAQTVEEYEGEKARFEDLHRSILACDDVLKSVELSLASFQRDLGAVSAEIETLQSRSTALNRRLENRKVVEKLLGPAVEEISISPAVVRTITDEPIDQIWIKALEDLEKRSRIIDEKLKGPDQVLAVTDIKPLLEDLTNKAIERIRDYLVAQIKSLRSPNINAQIIQQQSFLKFKGLYTFLARHHGQLADEIAQAYIYTMRWYYLSHFTSYRDSLAKMPLFTIEKSEGLATDPSSASKSSQPAHDTLSLGRRIDVLKRPDPSAITAYLASDTKATSYLEIPFYNFNLALISNASTEYTFLTSFFSPSHSYQRISSSFSSIFAPTFSLGTSYTRSLTETTYDCLGLLLCVRLNQSFAFELQRQKVPVAESYINGTNMLLWPRFQLAMDNHIESLKRATTSSSLSSRAISLTSSSSAQSTAPHPLTQRFALFLAAILQLSPDAASEESEPVGSSLARLMSEAEAFLGKVARNMPAGKKERFLSSNWSLVVTIIGETGGRLAGVMRERAEAGRDAAGAGGG
ncbi:MAG: hypothetical protein Q9191_003363 [Dirinaria sp. TL-2023a]